MTIMQNLGIFLCGLIFELLMYMFTIGFYDDDDGLVIGSILVNMLAFLAILLAWANGVKFPLK